MTIKSQFFCQHQTTQARNLLRPPLDQEEAMRQLKEGEAVLASALSPSTSDDLAFPHL